MKEFQQIGDDLLRIARDLILRDGFLDPVVFVKTPGNLKLIPVQPFLDVNKEQDKQILSRIIKRFASDHNASAVYMITEGWIYALSDMNQDYENFQRMTAEEKQKIRKEVAIVTFRTAAGSCCVKTANINRNNGNAWLDNESDWFTECESGLIPKWTE